MADEMGLGKTLVILSVIAGSLDRAQEFEGPGIDETQSQTKANSQATLILVPSSRMAPLFRYATFFSLTRAYSSHR